MKKMYPKTTDLVNTSITKGPRFLFNDH